jgi:hypothetical protein
MDLYTFYTPSHYPLYEKLEKSISRLNSSINLIVEIFDQECSSGEYMTEGWSKTMKKKVDLILKAIDKGDVFIHSDCDIIFLQDPGGEILKELGSYDLAFQSDYITGREIWYCMGFFICRPSPKVRELFLKVYENIDHFDGNDQLSLNNILSTYKNPNPPGFGDVKYKLLSERFYTYGQSGDDIRWEGQSFNLPSDLITFHANWTVGVDRKVLLIDYVLKEKEINV